MKSMVPEDLLSAFLLVEQCEWERLIILVQKKSIAVVQFRIRQASQEEYLLIPWKVSRSPLQSGAESLPRNQPDRRRLAGSSPTHGAVYVAIVQTKFLRS